jgi:EAL domain-containing protein (putative c-di-GMP-specific phosphodiesterase class I)
MVKNAGYRIVAEGIETQAMLEKVRQIGFDYAQGYYFGKPA